MSTNGENWLGAPSSEDYDSDTDRRTNSVIKETSTNNTWRPLQLLNLYRLLISGGFCVLLITESNHSLFNEINSAPLVIISICYLILSLCYVVTIVKQSPSFNTQVTLHIITDIIAITLLAHYSW